MLATLSTWFRHRPASGVKFSNDQPPSSSDAVSAATIEAIQARVARWFARKLPAQVALAQASAPALACQSPQRRGLVDRGTLCGAKPFAEALQAHDEVAAQPESRNRKWLYRVLDERDLIVTNGGQRIWNLFVTGPGEPLPRFVSALKLAPALYAGLELGPVFQGSVEPARAERKPAVIDKAESASLQSQ